MSRCGCDKELVSQSALSPGLVKGDEPLVYSLVDPETFINGSIKALKHDRLKKGQLSICRANYISGEEAREKTVVGQLERDSSRTEHGFAWAVCDEIRDIKLESLDVGAFCVTDDALEGFPAHAHLGYSQVEDKKNERLGARGNLLKLLEQRGHNTDWSGAPFLQAEVSSSQKKAASLFSPARRAVRIFLRIMSWLKP